MLASEQGASSLGLQFGASSEPVIGGSSSTSQFLTSSQRGAPLELPTREEARDALGAARAAQDQAAQAPHKVSPKAVSSTAEIEQSVDIGSENQISQATTAEP